MPKLPQLGRGKTPGDWSLAHGARPGAIWKRNMGPHVPQGPVPCGLGGGQRWSPRWLHPGLQSISLSGLIEPSMNQEGTFAALSTFQWMTPQWDRRIDLLSAHSSPFLVLTLLCLHIYSPFYPLQIFSSLYLSSLFGRPSNFRLAAGFFFLFHMNHNNHLILTTVSCYLSTSSPSFSFLRQLPLV